MSKRCKNKMIAALAVLTLLLTGLPFGAAADNGDRCVYSEIANPIATQEARNLYYYLQGMGAQDGLVVGAFDTSVTKAFPNGNNYDLINETFGVKPGLYSTRYYWTGKWNTAWPNVDSNPKAPSIGYAFEQEDSANGATAAKGINDVLYNHYKDGAILLIHADGFEAAVGEMLYKNGKIPLAVTKNTDYDDAIIYLDKTNPDRDPEASALFWGYIEQCADALEDLESRGVGAYLFRPFVEMNSKDFYGDSDEGYEAFKRVWQQLYDYFYKERKLKGCLLTFAPADYLLDSRSAEKYYPGNEYVDVLSPTRYTDGDGKIDPPSKSNYSWMETTGKPLGFSEFSVRQGESSTAAGAPRGDWNYALNVLLESYPRISWVNTWTGTAYSLFPPGAGGSGNNNGEHFLKSPYTLLVDDLPDFKSSVFTMPGVIQFYDGKSYTGSYSGMNTMGDYSLSELKDYGVKLSSVKSIKIQKGYGITFFSEENGEGTAYSYLGSVADFDKLNLANKVKSVRMFEVSENVALMKDITASAGEDEEIWKANDGRLSRWVVNDSPTSWLELDLNGTYLINRWVVKHAGAAGEDSVYNTSSFKIQYSNDRQNWQTASSIIGNRNDISDVTVPAFNARYVRLLIEKANSTASEKNRACIAELELYGILSKAVEDAPSSFDTPQEEEPSFEPDVPPEESDTPSDDNGSSDNKPSDKNVKPLPSSQIPWVWIGIGGGLIVIAAGIAVFIVLKRKKVKIK